jgi:hypothetical protein
VAFTSPSPRDNTWGTSETLTFLREVHRRYGTAGSFTWDPPNVPANSTVDTTLTDATVASLSGMRAGMLVTVSPPSTINAGIMVVAWCGASSTITIRLANLTAGAINPASGDWVFSGVIV